MTELESRTPDPSVESMGRKLTLMHCLQLSVHIFTYDICFFYFWILRILLILVKPCYYLLSLLEFLHMDGVENILKWMQMNQGYFIQKLTEVPVFCSYEVCNFENVGNGSKCHLPNVRQTSILTSCYWNRRIRSFLNLLRNCVWSLTKLWYGSGDWQMTLQL